MPLIPLEAIEPDPDNVRDDEGDVTELVASLRSTGLVNPLSVYPVATDVFGFPCRWRLAAGHRRRKALRILCDEDPTRWGEVQCTLREPPADNLERLDTMTAENLHREQLNPIEEARVYKVYRDAGLSQPEIAARTGRAQGTISYALMWLDTLTDDEQKQLAGGQMTRAKAIELVKGRRRDAGTARTDLGGSHRYGYSVPWFTDKHPRADDARVRCRLLGHDPRVRLGPACGPCWEATLAGGVRPAVPPRPAYDPPVPYGDERGVLVTRAGDLAELHALAGGVRETVMTATPARVRLLLDRAFRRLTDSVEAQQRADENDRRTLTEAVTEFVERFEADTPEVEGATA